MFGGLLWFVLLALGCLMLCFLGGFHVFLGFSMIHPGVYTRPKPLTPVDFHIICRAVEPVDW